MLIDSETETISRDSTILPPDTPHLGSKTAAAIFYFPATTLIDDTMEIPEFFLLESLAADEFWPRPAALDSTSHKVYDAGLIKNANLHWGLNKAGVPYFAIYVDKNEMLSCERDHEQGMIDYWNQGKRSPSSLACARYDGLSPCSFVMVDIFYITRADICFIVNA